MKAKLIEIDKIKIRPCAHWPHGFAPANTPPFESLKRLIHTHGMKIPVFIDRENFIVSGEYRFMAAVESGEEQVPCIVVHDLAEATRLVASGAAA